jgi:hypothetical protein
LWIKQSLHTSFLLSFSVANLAKPRYRNAMTAANSAANPHLPQHGMLRTMRHLRSESHPLYYLAVSIFMWFLIFGAGVAIPSQPYRDLLVNSSFSLAGSQAPIPGQLTLTGWNMALIPLVFVVIIISFTPTNLVLMCCSGAMAGAYANQSIFIKHRRIQDIKPDDLPVPGITAMLHGLCVYLGIVGGLIVVQGAISFDSKDPNQYMRLAAVATLFSVVAGTNRFFLRDVICAFTPFVGGTNGKKGDEHAAGPNVVGPGLVPPEPKPPDA